MVYGIWILGINLTCECWSVCFVWRCEEMSVYICFFFFVFKKEVTIYYIKANILMPEMLKILLDKSKESFMKL